jgi:hypothetical protein
MTDRISRRIWLLPFVVAAAFAGAAAQAQTMGPDEAVTRHGAVTQKLVLTEAQKSAIYNAVLGQRVRATTHAIQPAVGAPVPPAVELSELPVQGLLDRDMLGGFDGNLLKYTIVEGEVVVVDSVQMRVVAVIRGGAVSGAIP